MQIYKNELRSGRFCVLSVTAIFLVFLLPALTACTASPQAVSEEERIVGKKRTYGSAHEESRCGARIKEEEVLVVDLETLDYDAELLERQVGPFQQTTETPVAVSGKGSGVEVDRRVRRLAAGLGCDVVLLGPVQKEDDYPAGLGMTAGGGGGKRESSYQLFRMGYRIPSPAAGPITVTAPDGVEVAAKVHSTGDLTVVLLHGWMCDQTYWENQVPALSGRYGVVTIDLAGHGLSGTDRQDWTIASLAEDVAAVVSELQLENVVLIGHSMGGRVALDAARLLPGTVLGVIGVDTLHDADEELDPEEVAGLLAGFEADFGTTCGGFVGSMFGDGASEALITDVTLDMCEGPADIGIALLQDYVAYDLAAALESAKVPVRVVNADKWPTNVGANRKYADFDAIIIEGQGHFLMQEAPSELNEALMAAVKSFGAGH